MTAFVAALSSFMISVITTPAVAGVARRFGVVDTPGIKERKTHRKTTPLWGGAAIFLAFALVILVVLAIGLFPSVLVGRGPVLGMILGGAILVVGGLLDDRYDLAPGVQFAFMSFASIVVVASGVGIGSVRSPFGGYIPLDQFTVPFMVFGHAACLVLPGDLLAFVWILGLSMTTKVLDGLDGLVAGITVIAGALIVAVALRPELDQPDVALLAAVTAGAFAGFLVWNLHPAKVFLGQAGSTLAGFLIASLAIVSGSKVATTMLVLGVPVIDLAIVIVGRIRAGRKPFSGDTSHLHYRLLAAGLSERDAVLLMYAFALAFGLIGLIASTGAKAAAFLVLAGILLLGSRVLNNRGNRYRE